ncbi:FAR1 DNA binding domain - like 10 [Theobroma cacao]|nr:FAR1 DNA binding domain - like 10 [Theobroma cacao]
MRVMDSKRWRVLEVTLEHNHLLGAKIYKSIKKMGSGTKRKLQSSSDAEVRTIKLYRALVIDAGVNGNPNSNAREVRNFSEHPNQLNLRKAWGFMVQRFGITDHEWLRSLYEDRARWAPVYLKDIFFAGMSSSRPGENVSPFFEKYVHKQTPVKEFLDKYELALQKKHKEETLADIESRNSSPTLRTRCSFELQLSKLYTREIFKRFQFEVEEMYSCFSTTQLHVDGPIIIFLVKERVLGEGNRREIRDYEVLYNRTASEVRCICSCFNFCGYLCRHALCVLNFNGVEEIPSKYILSRWKKDYKRLYVPDQGFNNVDVVDRIQWFNQLYRSALQVVEEGAISLDHYKVALQAFEESLNRVHEVEEKQENTCFPTQPLWIEFPLIPIRLLMMMLMNLRLKETSEANRPRPETRTGCPAMIKFRLMENRRWRIIEVELDHNHLISPASGKFYKSHKHIGLGTKRALQLDGADEVKKIKLFRTVVIDVEGNESADLSDGEFQTTSSKSNQLRLKEGDAQAETSLAGMFPTRPDEVMESFFDGYLDKRTSLKEFLDKYEQALQENHQLETLADMDSRNSGFTMKSRCYFELQLAKLYTNNILREFEREVEGMYSCFGTRQINVEGQIMTYMVREQIDVEANRRETRDFEVLYNATEMEVLCVCGLFNLRGYLCRHALSVLHQNGMEEIPPQYILSRWRKDIKRSYVLNHSCGGIDVNNPVHRYDHLYKCIMQVVEEGRKSQDRYKDTVQALDEILSKLHLVQGHL